MNYIDIKKERIAIQMPLEKEREQEFGKLINTLIPENVFFFNSPGGYYFWNGKSDCADLGDSKLDNYLLLTLDEYLARCNSSQEIEIW